MKIHEYQAKEIFKKYNIPVPRGKVAFTKQEILDAANELGNYPVVIKAQVHAGGRGKAGGVKLAKSSEEVSQIAESMLNMVLVTHQTGPEGKVVRKVLVEKGLNIEKEYYMAVVMDRSTEKIVIMASEAGGMDIEEVAEKSPEKIIKVFIDPLIGISSHNLRNIVFGLNIDKELQKPLMSITKSLYSIFVDLDCSLVEINPLVLTKEGKWIALDAKINFDDNGLFRHKDIMELRDIDEEDPLEVEASKYGLNYIKLDGNVGNIVNGAGLAMATMDLIKRAGAEPANFLDVGGGASAEMVENGFKILLSDKNVKAILINIFGGILRCDVLAEGVVAAAKKVGVNVPVVVRMEGTNAERGREILLGSGLNLKTAKDLKEAAKMIAELV
ncbi:ADP-forming succinate--CoA ligase subunit beta [Desulfothermus naphthae]